MHKHHDITIVHLILLPFLSVPAVLLRSCHAGLAAVVLLKVVEGANLGLDEATLKVRMNNAGSLRS